MGEIEEKVRKRRRKEESQKIILGLLIAGGAMSVALVAPKLFVALDKIGIGKKLMSWQKQSVSRSLQSLVDKGQVEWYEGRNGKKFIAITSLGRKRLHFLEIRDFKIKKPKRWDRKWRIIIFDIQEKKRKVRNSLRLTLKRIGFVRLQDSVWVYPYPCEELTMLIKADLELGRHLLYVVADEIENDKHLRNEFGLQ